MRTARSREHPVGSSSLSGLPQTAWPIWLANYFAVLLTVDITTLQVGVSSRNWRRKRSQLGGFPATKIKKDRTRVADLQRTPWPRTYLEVPRTGRTVGWSSSFSSFFPPSPTPSSSVPYPASVSHPRLLVFASDTRRSVVAQLGADGRGRLHAI